MPFLLLLYLVCYLDRVNIGFAALQMNRDLGLTAAAYGLGAGIFFIGYSLFEIPSNLILARVGARLWIGRIMITWGILASAMMFVRDTRSLYILRFLLGVAEGGFFPGIAYYLYGWFPGGERVKALSAFMTAIPLSAVIGGPISGLLLGLNGRLGLAGWQWLFLVEGAPAILLGFIVLAVLTDRPRDATWLADEEREWLTVRIEHERRSCEATHGFTPLSALANPTIWRLAVVQGLAGIAGYSISLWLPQIIRAAIGESDFVVGVLSAVPNLIAMVAMVLVSARVDRTGERVRSIVVGSIVAAVGYAASAYVLHAPALIVPALTLGLAGTLSTYGPTYALPSFFLTGRAAAASVALIAAIANVGGFVGPYLVGVLKDMTGDYKAGLLALGLVIAVRIPIARSLQQARVLVRA